MITKHKQSVQVFRRIRDFLRQNVPVVAFTGSVERLVEQLTGVIERLERLAREQGARTRVAVAGTAIKRKLVVSLRREYLRPIARAAKALFPADDALLRTFAMPQVRDYQGIIAAAESMAQNASSHRQRFVEAGFPPDFVESIQKAASDLRSGIDTRAAELGRRAASTAGLRQEYARGRDVVRVLDAMVAPRLRPVPERLAEWRTLSKFESVPSGAAFEEAQQEPSSLASSADEASAA
jgi:hypothetical protein